MISSTRPTHLEPTKFSEVTPYGAHTLKSGRTRAKSSGVHQALAHEKAHFSTSSIMRQQCTLRQCQSRNSFNLCEFYVLLVAVCSEMALAGPVQTDMVSSRSSYT